jgi:hypothetical protein
VQYKDKYGYIDTTFNLVIPFKYNFAYFFQDGYARVKLNGKIGLINKNGKEVIPLEFQEMDHLSKIYSTKKDGHWGLIDTNGRVLIPFKYDRIYDYKNGRAIATLNSKYGVVDTLGQELVKFEYERIIHKKNLYFVVKNNKHGIIDYNGKIILPCVYKLIYGFNYDRGIISGDSTSGYINENCQVVIPLKFQSVGIFNLETAWVKMENKLGLIDTLGNIIIPFKYEYIFEYKINDIGNSYPAMEIEDEGLSMTQISVRKYFVRKYKHPICCDDRYFLRRYFSTKVSMWNGYVGRDGIEYFED